MTAIDFMGKHRNGHGGAIVNIGSYLGLMDDMNFPVYCASKHAVVSFVRCMKVSFLFFVYYIF